ncbi:MAG: Proline--tRNA ligase [Methanonatronarchaeales archaeon]|nr:Proline--tRNA ligase [Methanonatronarchaeales archaeon]
MSEESLLTTVSIEGPLSMSLPPKEEFSEWYNEVLRTAEIMDVRYPVKGMYVWHPFGFELKDRVYDELKAGLRSTGHDEAMFPLLIPRTELMKEGEHIADFEKEVFWVDRAGVDELEEPLALRPTSETAIYPMFRLWIRSHTDLPLKVFQVVNTFRYETEHTRPLIRLREITSFKEAHTAHASAGEAEAQVDEALGVYGEFFESIGVPFTVTRRPSWDKFPGAEYTYAFDTLMPNGRTLQIGTVHNLGENFAETFDVTFEDEDGEQRHVHQTCYGISERCVAAVIGVHGDDNGLRLPWSVAPVQVAVVPILFAGSEEEVMEACLDVEERLDEEGIRVELDDSDDRPGEKFFRWELRGAPVRIEIGPRDLESDCAKLVSREGEETAVPLEGVVERVQAVASEYDGRLFDEAAANLEDELVKADTIEGARGIVGRGVAVVGWCGEDGCGKSLEEQLNGDLLGALSDREGSGECIGCGSGARVAAAVARTY